MAFYCLNGTQAQPVLNNPEGFKPGWKFTTYNIAPAGVVAGNGGANVSWNFASLPINPNDTLVMEILSTASTTFGASFPTASYVEKHGDGSLAYIKKAGNTAELLGYVRPASTPMWYHDSYTFLKKPFGYQDFIDDTTMRGYRLGSDSMYGRGVTRTIADGWGTLILPGKTYTNVLRLKFEQEHYDTSALTSVVTYSKTASYAWFDVNHYASLLKIDSVIIQNPVYEDTLTDVEMLKEEIVTTIQNKEWHKDIHTYYADQQIILAGALQRGDVIAISIYDAAGRLIERMNLQQQDAGHMRTIDMSQLPHDQLYIARVAIIRNGEIRGTAVKFRR